MPLEAFDLICPETAARERAVVAVTAQTFGVPPGRYVVREFYKAEAERAERERIVPPGRYVVREFYCKELNCDCHRVLAQFFRSENGLPPQMLAAINFGWEQPRYHRKWSQNPTLWRQMSGATLEHFSEQGPDAKSFLALFKNSARQPAFVGSFQRHYALVKTMLAQGRWLSSAH